MKTFRIVENSDKNLDEIYPEFKKDFLDPDLPVKDLKKKYDLSVARYRHLREKVLEETGLQEKPSRRGGRHYTVTENRYIVQHKHGKCTIYKTIDRYKKSFGTYPDFTTAKYVRDKLVQYDWDETVASDLKRKYSQ